MDGDETMIVAGLGFRTSCSAEELVALVRRVEQTLGLLATALAAPESKAIQPELILAAGMLDLELISVGPAALLAAQPHCLSRSAFALAAVGFAAVSEACALAAVGAGGVLLAPKLSSAAASCALARGPLP